MNASLLRPTLCVPLLLRVPVGVRSYVQRAVRLKEAASRWFFQQLIIGLDYCHRRGVVNRDIKLENTLLQVRLGAGRWVGEGGCLWVRVRLAGTM